jgi:ethanolamine utilization protein EutQ
LVAAARVLFQLFAALHSFLIKQKDRLVEFKLMPTLISQPTRIQSAGNKPKLIDEYIGRVNSQTSAASVAHMRSPQGWMEPGQTPVFDEFTVVLKGTIQVEHEGGSLEVSAGQAVIAHAGEWVRYSTPHEGGAEYIAVCLPAFSMDTVRRDEK